MRLVSLNARRAHDAEYSDELEVLLVHIDHPDLPKPVRLSTDPTERYSVDPLVYCTRSTWLTTDDSPFLSVMAAGLVPDDVEDFTGAGALVLAALDHAIARLLRSTTYPMTVNLAVVLAGSPDAVEFEALGLKAVAVEGNSDTVTLQFSRALITGESWPSGRMTRARFPSLGVS